MFNNLTRDSKIEFLQSPVWNVFREELMNRKIDCYQSIVDENSNISKVKSKADKMAIIDEIFAIEKDLIDSVNRKGE